MNLFANAIQDIAPSRLKIKLKNAVLINCAIIFFACQLVCFPAIGYASEAKHIIPPDSLHPIELSISLHINNIYNINTLHETYQVDGYLVYTWFDSRMKFDPETAICDPEIYINERASDLISNSIWFPSCEFVNVQGSRTSPNIRIEIYSNGKILYTERFFETFIANMNYKSFPFDTQFFNIIVEPWGYNNQKIVLANPKLYPKLSESGQIIDKWQIDTMYAQTAEKVYDHLGTDDKKSRTWSRAIFEIKAKRMSGYFIWQVLFPLIIIIFASFVIFWITDFAIQIGIGFSLMLTVVAFNFYSASILPKLPYNTYIESVIIVGYVFIFLGIIAVTINYRLNKLKNKADKNKLLKLFRIVFPIAYLITMCLTYLRFNC